MVWNAAVKMLICKRAPIASHRFLTGGWCEHFDKETKNNAKYQENLGKKNTRDTMLLGDGQEIEITGIVMRSQMIRGQSIATITNGSETYKVIGKEPLANGVATISGTIGESEGETILYANSVETLFGNSAKTEYKKIVERSGETISITDIEPLVTDEVMIALKPKLLEAALKILTSKKLGRFVLLRFHGDADGVSGAMALTKMCRMYAIQQNSAVYSVKDAMKDLAQIHYETMPLAIMLDFGSSDESAEGIQLLKASGAEILVIDHHPCGEKIKQNSDLFVSPWIVDDTQNTEHKTQNAKHKAQDSETQDTKLETENRKLETRDQSQYPAGYLAVEVARAGGLNNENYDVEPLARISCAGDKSGIMKIDEKDKECALVLDYMASYSGFGNNLDFYENIMKKPELFKSMLLQAKEKIEQIYESVGKTAKIIEESGIKIVSIDLEKLAKKHEFPSKGKIATRVFESMQHECANTGKPLVVIGYGGGSVVFRINEDAVARGIEGNKIIEQIKESMPDFAETGGGHAKAASVRVRDGFEQNVAKEAVEVIKRAVLEMA